MQNIDDKNILEIDNLKHNIEVYNYVDISKEDLEISNFIENIEEKKNYNIFRVKMKNNEQKEIFIKYSPLFDVVKYLAGKIKDINHDKSSKLDRLYSYYNNAAYVDAFFSYILSKLASKDFIHGIGFYGFNTSIKRDFIYDIIEDIDFLSEVDYFSKKNTILYKIIDERYDLLINHSRKLKENISILGDTKLVVDKMDNLSEVFASNNTKSKSISSIGEIELDISRSETISDDERNSDDDDSSDSDFSEYSDEESNSGEDDEESNSGEDDEESNSGEDDEESNSDYSEYSDDDEEETLLCNVYNIPVNMIVIEKLDDTLDNFMENNEITNDEWSSIFFQVIIMLSTYQKLFDFTHNDLHTNNIMYTKTDIEFLYYCFNDTYYKVPTFGKIYKIIDFGRSIYKFGEKQLFSNSFSEDGDAYTQYNCEPFFNKNKKEIHPNKSFDLCRLGCSLFDYFFESIDETHEITDEIKQIVNHWCLDDDNKNILYKKNGNDRFPDFKLYQKISRIVNNKIPDKELENTLFKKYIVDESSCDKKYTMNIDNLSI
jgi:hypothetical protein